jgi:integrase
MAEGGKIMLSEAVSSHIELYRNMGFKYKTQEYMLLNFAEFATSRSEEFIRTETVIEWAASAPSVRRRHDRLLVIRRLAAALSAEDDRHQIPPPDVFGRAPKPHRTCHIFAEDEIYRLLQAASQLTSRRSIRPATCIALLSLIAATGLRVSEALNLQLSDITEDGLLIRETKFQKSRLVPLHESARRGLQQYLTTRKRTGTVVSNVFVSKHGTALPYSTVNAIFLRLARLAGLRGGPGLRGCRIHDLRHTFAVRSLEQCAPDRKAVARHMAALSTYLGHAHVSDTYWYLHATPKLLGDVAAAAESLHQRGGDR